MSRVGVDTFVMLVHFLNSKWEYCHVTIDFFETTNTTRSAMALQVNDVFTKYNLNSWIITYIKDEGNNLLTMTMVLIFIVWCEPLNLIILFMGAC
jgi:hypothetical protein